MLQPSESLATHRSVTAQQSPVDQPLAPASNTPRPSPKRLVTKKELIFIFVACSLAAGLLRTRDTVTVESVWRQNIDPRLYSNGQFPEEGEKLPPPIVTDLDSDGLADMVVLTYDNKINIYNFPVDKKRVSGDMKSTNRLSLKFVADVWELSEGGRPVSMATGYLQPYQSMLQVRHQVIAVLTSDWTVLCFDHELKLLWKNKLLDIPEITVSEATLLVVPVSIEQGDGGVVIVGGREINGHRSHQESIKRIRRGALPDDEQQLLTTLGSYSVMALEGRTGEQRWSHTPSQPHITPAYPPSSGFQHLKLLLHKQFSLEGEVSWHQYSNALRDTMPHSWRDSLDTHFTLGHFKKDKRTDNKQITEHISSVRDMAMEHIAGLAFGGQQPHTSDEHVESPNVLILHSMKGISVYHLFFGRPLVSLPLSPYHSAHADLDADGTIDRVTSVVNPGEGGPADCLGRASSIAAAGSKVLFSHSICKATHWTESFAATDQWFPAINEVGRKSVDHDITEPLAPVLVKSVYHGAPLKLHLGGAGWSLRGLMETYIGAPRSPPSLTTLTHSQRGQMYDSVFVLSSGRVTSVGPQGEFNWQIDIIADWNRATEVIYNPQHSAWQNDPLHISFLHGSFTPSATALSLRAFGQKDHVLVVGWEWLDLLAADEGEPVATYKTGCQAIASPVVADFTGDGWNDLVISCSSGYIGLSVHRQSGLWHSTIVSMFVGVVIVVVAVYTRQRNFTLMPVMKTAQD